MIYINSYLPCTLVSLDAHSSSLATRSEHYKTKLMTPPPSHAATKKKESATFLMSIESTGFPLCYYNRSTEVVVICYDTFMQKYYVKDTA